MVLCKLHNSECEGAVSLFPGLLASSAHSSTQLSILIGPRTLMQVRKRNQILVLFVLKSSII